MNRWPEVTNAEPCDICVGHRRCKRAPDGNAVRCVVVADESDEWEVIKRHATGATFRRRGSACRPASRSGGSEQAVATSTTAAATPTQAPADVLDRAYGLLLKKIGHLTTLHKLALKN